MAAIISAGSLGNFSSVFNFIELLKQDPRSKVQKCPLRKAGEIIGVPPTLKEFLSFQTKSQVSFAVPTGFFTEDHDCFPLGRQCFPPIISFSPIELCSTVPASSFSAALRRGCDRLRAQGVEVDPRLSCGLADGETYAMMQFEITSRSNSRWKCLLTREREWRCMPTRFVRALPMKTGRSSPEKRGNGFGPLWLHYFPPPGNRVILSPDKTPTFSI